MNVIRIYMAKMSKMTTLTYTISNQIIQQLYKIKELSYKIILKKILIL